MEQSLTAALGLTPLPPDPARDAEIGASIRRHRAAAGLSVDDVAGRAGLTSEQLTGIENGDARLPVPAAPHLARALAVTIKELLGR